jgi:hypothetical protein
MGVVILFYFSVGEVKIKLREHPDPFVPPGAV